MASRLTAVALLELALASLAAAMTPILDRAAESARGRSVYVHPDTKQLTAAEAGRLERQIEQQGRGPIYIAILPARARGGLSMSQLTVARDQLTAAAPRGTSGTNLPDSSSSY